MINHEFFKAVLGYTLISVSIFGIVLSLNYLFSWGWFEDGFSITTRGGLFLDNEGGSYTKGKAIDITSGIFTFYGLCAIAGCLILTNSNRKN